MLLSLERRIAMKNKSILKKVLSYIGKYKYVLFVSLIFAVLSVALTLYDIAANASSPNVWPIITASIVLYSCWNTLEKNKGIAKISIDFNIGPCKRSTEEFLCVRVFISCHLFLCIIHFKYLSQLYRILPKKKSISQLSFAKCF